MSAHSAGLDPEGRRLLWRCRRGMKELDVLLERYVRSRLANSSSEDRATLTRLLELPDPLLFDYVFGHIPVMEPSLARLVAAIRQSPSATGVHPPPRENICVQPEL